MFGIKTALDDERDELMEFFHGSAELEEYGRGMLVDVRRDEGSLGWSGVEMGGRQWQSYIGGDAAYRGG